MSYRTRSRGIITGVGCACVGALLLLTPFGRSLDYWFMDACFVIRGSRPSGAKALLIAIDEDTLDQLRKPSAYMSPELARAVRYAEREGAKAIGLDVFIPESLSGLPEIEEGIGDARLLGEAVADSSKVVLPQYYDVTLDKVRRPLRQWSILADLKNDRTAFGYLNFTEDDDQFIRRQLLLDDLNKPAPEPCFALALYARARGVKIEPEAGVQAIKVGDQRVPLDEDGRLRINYVGPSGSIPVIPLAQLLKSERAGRSTPELRDALVMFGVTGVGQKDLHATPYANGAARLFAGRPGRLTDGSEIHANTYATLYDGAFLTRPWWVLPLPWMILAGGALGATFARLNLTRGAGVLVLYLVVLAFAGYGAFRYLGWVMSTVPLALTGALTYSVVLARRWSQLRRIMAVVKSEAITRALEADPRRLDPGGELREVTALFADIRGFTTFSEHCGNDPRKVVALLNAYFGVVVPLIEDEGGTVMSFMGDGVLVLFGSPVTQPDHASRAVRAAIRMANAIRNNSELWTSRDYPGMRVGIGVHTGPAVVGAVGGPTRLDYTAIGDTINTASRVEGQTKELATEILITASTLAALGSDLQLINRCHPVPDPVRLAGKAEPIDLFRVEAAPDLR